MIADTGATPTTADIRECVALGKFRGNLAFMNGFQRRAAFDRWLAQHDAELRAEADMPAPPPPTRTKPSPRRSTSATSTR